MGNGFAAVPGAPVSNRYTIPAGIADNGAVGGVYGTSNPGIFLYFNGKYYYPPLPLPFTDHPYFFADIFGGVINNHFHMAGRIAVFRTSQTLKPHYLGWITTSLVAPAAIFLNDGKLTNLAVAAINKSDHVTGVSTVADGTQTVFVWSKESGMVTVGSWPAAQTVAVTGFNDSGEVMLNVTGAGVTQSEVEVCSGSGC